jgi:isopentenyldiphosphate isomerase
MDQAGNITNKIERWKAHREGILHRGFTVILEYQDSLILQHRKHPAFDHTWDLSYSSHPVFNGTILESDADAISRSLNREWILNDEYESDVRPEFIGQVYYRAKDEAGIYTEHEIDFVYRIRLKEIPKANPDFSYGFEMINRADINNQAVRDRYPFSPWVFSIFGSLGSKI